MKYPPLPMMVCEPNCGDCCGVAPCSQGEFEAIERYATASGIKPTRQGLKCPWYQGGVCSVHSVRPAICRLFGHVDRLVCSRGHNVNIAGTLLRKWHEKMLGATRLTHEAIDGWTIEQDLAADLNRAANEPYC